MHVACVQVIRAFFAALNAFNQATVGEAADNDNMFAAYDAVQHYMKFICMPKLAGQHTGPVCHASNHGTQVTHLYMNLNVLDTQGAMALVRPAMHWGFVLSCGRTFKATEWSCCWSCSVT